MKRLFFLAVALLLLWTGSSEAQIGRNRQFRSNNGGGPVSRLIELERRKNAWLRRTFLER